MANSIIAVCNKVSCGYALAIPEYKHPESSCNVCCMVYGSTSVSDHSLLLPGVLVIDLASLPAISWQPRLPVHLEWLYILHMLVTQNALLYVIMTCQQCVMYMHYIYMCDIYSACHTSDHCHPTLTHPPQLHASFPAEAKGDSQLGATDPTRSPLLAHANPTHHPP